MELNQIVDPQTAGTGAATKFISDLILGVLGRVGITLSGTATHALVGAVGAGSTWVYAHAAGGHGGALAALYAYFAAVVSHEGIENVKDTAVGVLGGLLRMLGRTVPPQS